MHATQQLPSAVYDAAQVASFDRRLIEDVGVPGLTLMQRAASVAHGVLQRRWPGARQVCVLCGGGNNAGDGYLIARLALQAGRRVRLVSLVPQHKLQGDAAAARAAFEAAGGEIETFADAAITADVVVDAVLGTGLSRDVTGRFAAAIARINEARERGAGVLAVDVASGIDASTGRRWGTAVRAHATATFIGLKLGLLTGAGVACSGEVVCDDLGAPAEVYTQATPVASRMHDDMRARLLPLRPADAHKGDHGHVLCLGGNRGMGGAIRMSAEAALRTGAGLVSVACHADHAAAMSQARPELMCRGVSDATQAHALLQRSSVVAVGPGLGQDDWSQALLTRALAADGPLVVDADALNLLAQRPQRRGHWIVTPHPGEAARLLETDTRTINNDRATCARSLARELDAVVVLKGAGSLVATADTVRVCGAGNPGMASGGMGDVLTGIIAALVAQGLALVDAAALGVWLHARAADAVTARCGQRGLLATDLLPEIMRQANP